jgi:hypothetical protein
MELECGGKRYSEQRCFDTEGPGNGVLSPYSCLKSGSRSIRASPVINRLRERHQCDGSAAKACCRFG